jgi:predicted oxidoreductase (fatty acid repression mutant protein)
MEQVHLRIVHPSLGASNKEYRGTGEAGHMAEVAIPMSWYNNAQMTLTLVGQLAQAK